MATQKEPTTEDLARQIDQLKSDIGALTETITDLGRATGEGAARSVKQRAEAARAAGEDHLAALQLQAESKLGEAESYVRKNPGTALGIAAGIGFLVGLMGARR